MIKKKNVNSSKRIGIFLLGVAQIICGAIILNATSGALSGFGVTMMMEGAKYCFDSVFRSDLIDDLRGYFTETAINYSFSLATPGV